MPAYFPAKSFFRISVEIASDKKSAEIRRNPQKYPSKTPQAKTPAPTADWWKSRAQLAPTAEKQPATTHQRESRAQLAPTAEKAAGNHPSARIASTARSYKKVSFYPEYE